VKAHVERISEEKSGENLLIFHDQTGKQTDFDFRGSIKDGLDRAGTDHVRGTIRLATTGVVIAVLGPGTWSIDALLYGRKRIDI